MTWQYTIEWHQPRDANVDGDAARRDVSRKNIVTVTSKPRSQMESSLITLKTWTSASGLNKTAEANATVPEDFRPLAVFAQVLKGGLPVLEARVMMTVAVELGNGSVVELSPVEMYDDGFGGENRS
jgi:hypothetical protein